jgi:uncharacterized protein YbjT (DUF2867 family)
MADPEAKVALLAGASGLVGGHVLGALLAASDFSRVYAITRRPLGREHVRLANRIVQFERLEAQLKGTTCHTAFCCLGATPGAGGDEDELRTVELGYVVSFARAARAANAQRFVMVSCALADARSRNPLYRVKAEAEQAVAALGFIALDILQPGALLGMRRQFRPADVVRGLTLPLMNVLLTGPREVRRAIPAREVAAAMLGVTRSGRRGTNRYAYAAIRAQALVKPPRGAPPPPSKERHRAG